MGYPFEYRRLGEFAYHVLSDPEEIKRYLLNWILREWQQDHAAAPDEHWTVKWMDLLPRMDFRLEIIRLEDIRPNADLMGVAQFQVELKERADDREESFLRGQSVEPLLVNRAGMELMDGYTRYTVLRRHEQDEVYVYLGSTGAQSH
jgi:hypothetical protein